MLSRKSFVTGAFSLVVASTLGACGRMTDPSKNRKPQKDDDKEDSKDGNESTATEDIDIEGAKLIVTTCGEPYTSMLKDYIKPWFEKRGAALEITTCENPKQCNELVLEKKADAAFCMTFDEYVSQGGADQDLDVAGSVFYEPFAIYSSKHASINEIGEKSRIAIPTGDDDGGRALQLLQQENIVILNDPEKIDSADTAFAEDPFHIDVHAVEENRLVESLDDNDYVIFAPTDKGPAVSDAMAIEAAGSPCAFAYAGVVVTRLGNIESKPILALMSLFKSEFFGAYMQKTFDQQMMPTA